MTDQMTNELTAELIRIPSQPLPPERSGVLTPFDPGTRVLPAGFQIAPPFRPTESDIVLEKDIAITLRDGTVIRADVLRPNTDQPVPVIVAWSPYGKGQGSSASVMGIFAMVGLSNNLVSGLEKFEGPDPAWWCAQGYAICHPDPRGCIDSEGDSVLWDRQEGRDCHDVIEWAAAQPWCNGKVGMSGTSYLAASQWLTAAERPPHLAAINPCEGISDTYRDLAQRGGMPDDAFAAMLQNGSFFGKGMKEDMVAEVRGHPLCDELWQRKIPDYDAIEVPAYVVASYSNSLHTQGTFRGWRRIASSDKWLRIHNSQEWPDYYDEQSRDDLRRFFDHYLRGIDNGWEQTPRVRYAVLGMGSSDDLVNQPADSFPPAGVTARRLNLDAATRTLSEQSPAQAGEVAWDATSGPRRASFVMRVDRATRLVGYPSVHLFMEARGSDDMDVFVTLQKLDVRGIPQEVFTVPNHGAMVLDNTDTGGSILRYKGANGQLRASMRHLDADLSTDDVPAHTFDRVEKLAPGEVVELVIDLSPIGWQLQAGEGVRLVVSSTKLIGPMMPGQPDYQPANAGQHVVHTGGEHASWLRLPVVAD